MRAAEDGAKVAQAPDAALLMGLRLRHGRVASRWDGVARDMADASIVEYRLQENLVVSHGCCLDATVGWLTAHGMKVAGRMGR